MVRLLFGLQFTDTQCGAKAFKGYVIEKVISDLTTSDFAFDIELLYKLNKNGYRVREIPVVWEEKGDSSLNLKKVVPAMFLTVLIIRILNSPFKWILENHLYRITLTRIG